MLKKIQLVIEAVDKEQETIDKELSDQEDLGEKNSTSINEKYNLQNQQSNGQIKQQTNIAKEKTSELDSRSEELTQNAAQRDKKVSKRRL